MSNEGHPADVAVRDLVDALTDLGLGRSRRSPTIGKLAGRISARSVPMPPRVVTLVPLMGPKWWRLRTYSLSDVCVVYCWDVWSSQLDEWQDHLADARIAGVITTSSDARRALAEVLPGKPLFYVPEAVQAARFSAQKPLRERSYDVLELGRKHPVWHGRVRAALSAAGVAHRYESEAGKLVYTTQAQFSTGLADARISVCFPRVDTHPESAGAIEAMTLRYLESMAAGCVLLGRAPRDLVQLFGYDPVVPVDWEDPVSQIMSILNNLGSYQAEVRRNLARLLEVGTWSTRALELRATVDRILKLAGV